MVSARPRLVLLAAGRSSRFGAPKQVAPLGPGGASLTAYTVVDALRAGFEEVVVVTSRDLQPRLASHLQTVLSQDLPVRWAYQDLDDLPGGLDYLAADRRKPWGTAQAILSAGPHLPTTFGVANADDWYGPEALEALAEALTGNREFITRPPLVDGAPAEAGAEGGAPSPGASAAGRPCPAVAVGYPVEATLSPSGGVSRGWISADPSGRISRVVELREVRAGGPGRILGVDPDGLPVSLPVGTPASMNLWGFHPCLLPLLEDAFQAFLEELGADGTSEFALSTAVDQLLETSQLELRLIPGGRRWFGVTHPGDAEAVSRRLEALHGDGTYSTPLARTLG